MNEGDDWEELSESARRKVIQLASEYKEATTLEELKILHPEEVTEDLVQIYNLISGFREPLPTPLRLAQKLAQTKGRVREILANSQSVQSPSEWGRKAEKLQAALDKAQSYALDLLGIDIGDDTFPEATIEDLRLGYIKIRRNMDHHQSDIPNRREKQESEYNIGSFWIVELIDLLKREAGTFKHESKLQTKYRFDSIQWHINWAYEFCESQGITLSKSPRSRFYRIVEWLLPHMVDVAHRIEKVELYKTLQANPSLLKKPD